MLRFEPPPAPRVHVGPRRAALRARARRRPHRAHAVRHLRRRGQGRARRRRLARVPRPARRGRRRPPARRVGRRRGRSSTTPTPRGSAPRPRPSARPTATPDPRPALAGWVRSTPTRDRHGADRPLSETPMPERYLVISSDCHAGPETPEYRPYLDPEYRDRFDESLVEREALLAQMREQNPIAMGGDDEFQEEWFGHEEGDESLHEGGLRCGWDAAKRDQELDNDGVAGEVIFPGPDAATGSMGAPVRRRPGHRRRPRPRAPARRRTRVQPLVRRAVRAQPRAAQGPRDRARSSATSTGRSPRSGAPTRAGCTAACSSLRSGATTRRTRTTCTTRCGRCARSCRCRCTPTPGPAHGRTTAPARASTACTSPRRAGGPRARSGSCSARACSSASRACASR